MPSSSHAWSALCTHPEHPENYLHVIGVDNGPFNEKQVRQQVLKEYGPKTHILSIIHTEIKRDGT